MVFKTETFSKAEAAAKYNYRPQQKIHKRESRDLPKHKHEHHNNRQPTNLKSSDDIPDIVF